jgi:hypothetical protein
MLTDTAIRNAKPSEKHVKFFDDSGLYLEVAPLAAHGSGSSTASRARRSGFC